VRRPLPAKSARKGGKKGAILPETQKVLFGVFLSQNMVLVTFGQTRRKSAFSLV
jgi:hypothetical protein